MNQYELLKKHDTLWTAWHHVSQSSLASSSASIRQAALDFNRQSQRNILSISSLISHGTYKFDKAEGYLKKKKNKTSVRPVVLSTVRDRVVQRAVLEVLYRTPELEKIIRSENSFGGINQVGVKDAIFKALKAIKNGAQYFLTSDISNFFTKIPKSKVIEKVKPYLDDQFIAFLNQSMNVELKNIAGLKDHLHVFPLTDIGVAQGCCLSPVVGNILLHEFDIEMNKDGITCIRYIDDFILLGSEQTAVRKAFKKAKGILEQYGLCAYDPLNNPDKASEGFTKRAFTYLGCQINGNIIAPSKDSQLKLITNLKKDIKRSSENLKTKDAKKIKNHSLVETMSKLDLRIESWSNQYAYCNDKNFRKLIDKKVNDLLTGYLSSFQRIYQAEMDASNRKRMLGVTNVEDCKIIKF